MSRSTPKCGFVLKVLLPRGLRFAFSVLVHTLRPCSTVVPQGQLVHCMSRTLSKNESFSRSTAVRSSWCCSPEPPKLGKTGFLHEAHPALFSDCEKLCAQLLSALH